MDFNNTRSVTFVNCVVENPGDFGNFSLIDRTCSVFASRSRAFSPQRPPSIGVTLKSSKEAIH